jgi:O-antigen/teichoic acid export membrane protein
MFCYVFNTGPHVLPLTRARLLPVIPLAPRLRAFLRGGAGVAVAMAVMNLAAYGYTILAARLLGPDRYGGFAAVMNLLLVVSVVSLGLQATAARRIASDEAHVAQIERGVLGVTWRAAVAIGGVLLLLTPVVDRLLRLDDLPAAAMLAATAVPFTIMGGQAGVLQGERRWLALGAVYVAAGVPRLLIGTALLAWRPSEFLALLAVALGQWVPVAVGWWALRHDRTPGRVSAEHRGRRILVEAVSHSQALFAYFALSNVDIVVARNALAVTDSGLYAGGLILTKAMMLLPQFVVVVAFPALSSPGQRIVALVRGLAGITALGVVGVLAALLLPRVALAFVGGREYAAIADQLWLFALLGTVLALLQLLVYSVLARRGRRSTLLIWAALAAVVVVGLGASTTTGLVVRVILVDTTLLVALLALSIHLLRRESDARRNEAPSSGGPG